MKCSSHAHVCFCTRAHDAQPPHLCDERGTFQSQLLCCSFGTTDHPIHLLQYSEDVCGLRLFQGKRCRRSHRSTRNGARQTLERSQENRSRRQNNGALKEILQFTDVAGPVVTCEGLQGRGGGHLDPLVHAHGKSS